MRRYCARKADIAFRLGLHPDQVTTDMVFDYELGHMDEGATCTLWPVRAPQSSISSGPYYTTAPGLAATGRSYTLLSGTGRGTE
jgi:hypothetical protein